MCSIWTNCLDLFVENSLHLAICQMILFVPLIALFLILDYRFHNVKQGKHSSEAIPANCEKLHPHLQYVLICTLS